MNKLLAALFCLFILSCSFDYGRANLAESLDSEIPDIQLFGAELTYVRGTVVVIESDYIDIYSENDKYNINDVEFREMDKNGEIRMMGRASNANIETDTNNVTLTGTIWIRSNKDEAEMKTSFVQWKDKERVIEGKNDHLLELERDDGSIIRGYGFRGDADSRELILGSQVTGQLVVEEEERVAKEEEEEKEDGFDFFDYYE